LETEFFNGYFREAAAPMLAYYQGLENYQVTNGINMHYKGYAYGILPGAFPLSVLYEMQTNLTAAQQLATNWYVIDRVNDMTNEFNWLITNAGLHGINLTNIASYPVLSSTTNLFTIALTNMAAKFPGYMPYENAVWNWPTPNCWFMQPWAQIQDTFNVTNAGIYTVAVTAIGAEAYNAWPVMEVCLGPGNGSALVNTTNYSTYNFTFTIPAGVWDLEIICPTGEGNFTISNIQIVFIGSPPPATSPILLTDAAKLPNGAFQFAFTNTPVGTNYITTNITTTITTNWSKWGPPKITGYTTNTTTTLTTNGSANTATVLTTTNLLLPLTNWTVLGTVTDNPPGQFQFTDPQATNHPLRFYRVRSP
jgi:hypothetical protein